MTTDDLFQQITAKPKWYIGVPAPRAKKGKLTADAATRMKERYKAGTLSQERIEELFRHFGFVKAETKWMRERQVKTGEVE